MTEQQRSSALAALDTIRAAAETVRLDEADFMALMRMLNDLHLFLHIEQGPQCNTEPT